MEVQPPKKKLRLSLKRPLKGNQSTIAYISYTETQLSTPNSAEVEDESSNNTRLLNFSSQYTVSAGASPTPAGRFSGITHALQTNGSRKRKYLSNDGEDDNTSSAGSDGAFSSQHTVSAAVSPTFAVFSEVEQQSSITGSRKREYLSNADGKDDNTFSDASSPKRIKLTNSKEDTGAAGSAAGAFSSQYTVSRELKSSEDSQDYHSIGLTQSSQESSSLSQVHETNTKGKSSDASLVQTVLSHNLGMVTLGKESPVPVKSKPKKASKLAGSKHRKPHRVRCNKCANCLEKCGTCVSCK